MPLDIAMNAATFRYTLGFEQFIAGCAAREIKTASIWGEDVDKVGLKDAARTLEGNGVKALGYNRAGPILGGEADRRNEHLESAKREIDKAATLGADHILLFTGGLPNHSKNLQASRDEAVDSFGELLDHARKANIKLAVEPLHPMLCADRGCIHTLEQANDICEQLGPGIGIVLDVYHVWWDENLDREIERAGKAGTILGFHVNDWLIPTTHILTDRGMMGDGVIDLQGIWHKVRNAGYAGPVEVEIFSERWWHEDPELVFNLAIERCRTIFGD